MNRKRLLAIIAICGIAALPASSPAYSQAFGLMSGTPIKQLDLLPGWEVGDPFGVYGVSVPDPSPIFSKYIATAMPKAGLCKLMGSTEYHTGEYAGELATLAFERAIAGLNAVYGASDVRIGTPDGVKESLREVSELVIGLRSHKIWIDAHWTKDDGHSVPDWIKNISASIADLGFGPYVTVTFTFDNEADCTAELLIPQTKGF